MSRNTQSFALGAGIFFIPYIFAWALLRAGYSSTARKLAFGWLVVMALALMLNKGPSKPAPAQTVAAGAAASVEAKPQLTNSSSLIDAFAAAPQSKPSCPGAASNRSVRPVASEIPLREDPSDSATRVLNKKATEAFGRKEYVSLDRSELLVEDCTTPGWSRIRVVQPSHLTFITGWIQTKHLRERQMDGGGHEVFTESNFEWTKRTKPFAAVIVAGVNKVHRENPRCKEVNTGSADISDSKGSRTNPVFYFSCEDKGDSFNVFFSKADVDKGNSLSGKPVDHVFAVNSCEAAAKQKSINPGTVKFSRAYSLAIVDFPNGRTKVQSSFTAANKFGAEATYKIECMLDGNGLNDVSIHEG